MQVLLDAANVARGLTRVAGEIVERNGGLAELILVGVRRGGLPVARHLVERLQGLEPGPIPTGTVDITLYRDDAASALPNPRIGPSEMPGPLEGKHVLLVDDVIGTGRTTRAALDAVLDYGRPRSIQLMVLIDRGGRELPIAPDYCVRNIAVDGDKTIDVVEQGSELLAIVQEHGSPTIPPGVLKSFLAGQS